MSVWYIYKFLPFHLQSLLLTAYNADQYRKRHQGSYRSQLEFYAKAWASPLSVWKNDSETRLSQFLNYAVRNSSWYSNFEGAELSEFPVLEKRDLIRDLDAIRTVDKKNAVVSLKGGTTGASMKVLYTLNDIQERVAILDSFRAKSGYLLGDKIAWLSGKN